MADPSVRYLRDLFGHHAWATLQLFDHCAALPAERLAETLPGTYGPIHSTLTHLVAAEDRYLRRLTEVPGEPLGAESHPSLPELRAMFLVRAHLWADLVERAPTLDLTMPPRPQMNWPETPHAEELLFL